MPPSAKHPLDAAIDTRRRELGLRWKDVYDRSGLSQETVRKIRHGLRDDPERTTDSEPKLEDVLHWARGSIQAIREDRAPTALDDDTDYPPWAAGDPFFEHIYRGPASDEEKMIAVRAVKTVREAHSGVHRATAQRRA